MNNYNLFSNVMGADAFNAPVLSYEEEMALLMLARDGDASARNELINHNMRLCIKVAKEYAGRGLDMEDLVMEGVLGLNEAISRFDLCSGYKFSTYASQWIRQKMGVAVLNDGRTIRLPASQVAKISEINKAKAAFTSEYDFEPDAEELSVYMGYKYDADDIDATLLSSASTTSMDLKLGDDDDSYSVGDMLFDASEQGPRSFASHQEDLEAMLSSLDVLNSREKDIVIKTYGFGCEELSAAEIAMDMGVSRERVRQILNGALAKLRNQMVTFPKGSGVTSFVA